MIDEDNSFDEGFSKPSYDGRLEYYKVLRKCMLAITQSSATSDFNGWLRMLRQMFAMVKGFIKVEDAERIKNSLIIIKTQLRNLNSQSEKAQIIIINKIDDMLQDVNEDIFFSSKHLLLPTESEESSEFNEKDFMKDSDL